jgi:quaternary ammonium compound-resistance protein SugE
MSRRYSLTIALAISVPLIVLLLFGVLTPTLKGAFGATFGWLSAGLFSVGLLSAGLFSVGIYSAGLFSVGIFSAGVFAVGIFAFGTYTVGIWSCGQYPVGVYTAQLKPEEPEDH